VISAPKGARWAVEDCALAAENLMLEAWARGLGSCWIGFAQDWLSSEAGRAMLEIPVSHTAVAPIIVGHPKGKVQPVPRRSPSIRWMGAGRGALAA
jgi:nitroreductase